MTGGYRGSLPNDGPEDPLQRTGHEQDHERPAGHTEDLSRCVAESGGVERVRQGDQGPHEHCGDDEGEQAQANGEYPPLDPVVWALATMCDANGDHDGVERVRHQPGQAECADDQADGDLTRRDGGDAAKLVHHEGGRLVGEGIGEWLELGGDVVRLGDEAVERNDGHHGGHERYREVECHSARCQQGVVLGDVADVVVQQGEQAGPPYGARAVAHRNHGGSDIPTRVPHDSFTLGRRSFWHPMGTRRLAIGLRVSMRRFAVIVGLAVIALSCAPADDNATSNEGYEPALRALVDGFGPFLGAELVDAVVAFDDPTAAWVLSDLLRFYPTDGEPAAMLGAGLSRLGFAGDPADPWTSTTNQLISADIAAPPGYEDLKLSILDSVDERWRGLFVAPIDMDLRYLSWGGVFIDDRPLGDARVCFGRGCIAALDLPGTTDAAGGDWYPEDSIVFGIVVEGEARAYPKHQMQVHEMVNDVVGGRHVAVPYCTLCGSAQAYFTDEIVGDGTGVAVERPLVMRTSGLLTRSNKVMFDLDSRSAFDTFTGRAVTGPLLSAGVELEQISVRVSTWGDWRAAHPTTTIVAPDGGVGRIYPDDPLVGRDDHGPIFPVGDVDARLGVQAPVVGVEAPDGTPIAFAVADLDRLAAGEEAVFAGVTVRSDGAGYVAFDEAGLEIPTHEAFWFAWSQFWPDTVLWPG